jgi:hypothetical protein
LESSSSQRKKKKLLLLINHLVRPLRQSVKSKGLTVYLLGKVKSTPPSGKRKWPKSQIILLLKQSLQSHQLKQRAYQPAPKAKDDGPSVGTQLGTAAAIVGTGLAGKAAYSRFKGRGSRLSLPKPPLGLPAPNVAANSPPKPKGGAKPKPITKPVTTQNASPKVNAAPKAKPVNPRSAKPKTLKPSAQAPNVMSQAPKALAAAPKDKAPVRPNSSPSKPYEWRSNRTLKLTPEMRVSPTVKLDPSTTKTAAEPKPKPKAKIKPRAVRSKPVITRTSTPKVVNVKIKPQGGVFKVPSAGGAGMTVNDLSGQFMGGFRAPMLPDALEDRMVMNRGGMVKKMSSGGSIARGGGAAKRGTKFKGSF